VKAIWYNQCNIKMTNSRNVQKIMVKHDEGKARSVIRE